MENNHHHPILDIHPSGKAVSVKPKYHLKIPVTPQLLNGFLGDEAFKTDHADYMHSRDFLVMPVHVSPLYCAIQKLPLKQRYTDSFESISILRTIIQCFRVNPYLESGENRKCIVESHNWMIEQTNALEEKMFEALEKLNTEDLKGFIQIMEQSTLERIHVLEETIWRMFKLERIMPLEYCLTPKVTPSFQGKPEDARRLMAHYFETKQLLRNIRMEKSLPDDVEYEPVRYFDIEAIRNGRWDPNTLYNSYLDPQTVKEYKLFLKL